MDNYALRVNLLVIVTCKLCDLPPQVSLLYLSIPLFSFALRFSLAQPDVRQGAAPAALHGNVTVSGLTPGSFYVLYRYNGTDTLPAGPPFSVGAAYTTPFTAKAATWTFADPVTFASNSATYYLAAAA